MWIFVDLIATVFGCVLGGALDIFLPIGSVRSNCRRLDVLFLFVLERFAISCRILDIFLAP